MRRLSDSKIKAAKATQKPYKMGDGNGLWLHVMPPGRRNPAGSKLWRFRFRQPDVPRVGVDPQGERRAGNRDSVVSLGAYPEVSLAQARDRVATRREQLAAGITPAAAKKAERRARASTFKAVALEWLSKQTFAPKTLAKTEWTFNDLLFPFIGDQPVAKLEPPEILEVLERIEKRGKIETAHRTLQRVSQVMRHAVATGRAKSNPARDLSDALKPLKVTHHPSIKDPTRIGEMLRAIDGFEGEPTTRAALKLAPLVFVRPGELRGAEWREFSLDGDKPTWKIPAARMKTHLEHLVPLSTQAVEILREIRQLTGRGKYVFPGLRSGSRPISNNTMNAALRRLGYTKAEMTAHGFRSMASTLLNEQEYNRDHIERQLAHVESNKVRDAYNAAEYLPARRKMLQEWGNYLDGLKTAGAAKEINP
jgi:integrase